MDRLKVPNAFAGAGIEGEHTVAEQVHAFAIGSVEIETGRTRRAKYPTALGIQSETAPRIRSTIGLTVLPVPSVIAELAGLRQGVENPTKLTGAGIVGANVSGGGSITLRDASADN